ncbi:OLC1v1023861C1 [Oldenlandia corymbosa var. corymbosa]|uniref:OLC1v1023861C1 n=1 Tax=Oldenlandia corymbosa var. corymbosa TaxID=529605 RepID=A0AAV1C3R3_OLDCO|nr:OLC1v1023861C1 [Oldenlandia corymbosa var. corymbosa]
MQEALPYKTWLPMPTKDNPLTTAITRSGGVSVAVAGGAGGVGSVFKVKGGGAKEELKNEIKVNAVIVIGKRGCCMSHVVKRLLQGLGVNPPVFEVEEEEENDVIAELERMIGSGDGGEDGRRRVQLPVVFIGGQLFGGLDRVMATHITGELTPILKKAGALWL